MDCLDSIKLADTTSVSCKELGMTFGIPLPGGGKFLGDITELSGFDWQGNTARLVKTVIEAWLKAAQP